MSCYSRNRKLRRRQFLNRTQNGFDRQIDRWQILDNHHIPEYIEYGQEFDFICCNQKDIYLLRLRKEKAEKFFINKSKGCEAFMYLIVESDFSKISDEL